MNFRTSQIKKLVAELSALLTPFGCVGVRTDYSVSATGHNRRTVVPERHGAGLRYALVSDRDNVRPRSRKEIRNFLGCDADTADKVLDAALALSELNDIGAWHFDSDDRPAKIMTAAGITGRAWEKAPGFQEAYDDLATLLPVIERIELYVHSGQKKTGKSQKGWIYFYDTNGNQVCAASRNLLITSLRDWFSDDADKVVVADRHLGRWAHQVNADLHDFIRAAMHLESIDARLGVTAIDFQRDE